MSSRLPAAFAAGRGDMLLPPTALAAGEGVIMSPAVFAAGRNNDNGTYALCAGVKVSCAKILQTSGFLAPSHLYLRMCLGENMLHLLAGLSTFVALVPALPPQRCV